MRKRAEPVNHPKNSPIWVSFFLLKFGHTHDVAKRPIPAVLAQMKKNILLVMGITAIAWLASCGQGEKASQTAAKPLVPTNQPGLAMIAADSPQLAQIRVEPVEMKMVPVDTVSSPGKVEANANRLAHVTLQLTGRVTAVYAKIGDFVRQGQPLLTVESADADSAVSTSLQAQASVTQSKSALAKAQLDLNRQKDLFDHGAVPEKEVLNGQAVVVQMQAGVEQAQAAAEQSRRRLQILGISPGSFGQRVTRS